MNPLVFMILFSFRDILLSKEFFIMFLASGTIIREIGGYCIDLYLYVITGYLFMIFNIVVIIALLKFGYKQEFRIAKEVNASKIVGKMMLCGSGGLDNENEC